jgi:hypothetical protein
LPPSLVSRIQNVVTWVERLRRFAPIIVISLELVRFDIQLMERSDITGMEYQQGTLAGWEAREYLLLKWSYRCAYCKKEAARWEVDHIIPRSRGGSNRIGKPLKDAAAVNSTRWELYQRLQHMGLPLETGTGGRTKVRHVTQHCISRVAG